MLEGFEARATLSALWLYGSVVSRLIPSGSSCDFRPYFLQHPQIHLVSTVLIIIRAMAEIHCPYLSYL